jgi:uncharacterized protein YchJ
MLWLVKHTVWVRTRTQHGEGRGIWIGSAHKHTALYHLQTIGQRDPCYCGSWRPYRHCCYRKDVARARRQAMVPLPKQPNVEVSL